MSAVFCLLVIFYCSVVFVCRLIVTVLVTIVIKKLMCPANTEWHIFVVHCADGFVCQSQVNNRCETHSSPWGHDTILCNWHQLRLYNTCMFHTRWTCIHLCNANKTRRYPGCTDADFAAVMPAAKNARSNCRGHSSIFRTATSFVSNNVSDTPRPLWVFPFRNGWQENGERYQINQLSQSQRNPMGRYPRWIQVIWTGTVSKQIYRWRTGVRHKYKIWIILFQVFWLEVDSCMCRCSVL